MTQPTTPTEVLATIGYDGFVRSLFNKSGDVSKEFAHAVLGIVTEIGEYLEGETESHAIDEAGDLTFYLEALRQVLDGFSPINVDSVDQHYLAAVGRLQDNPELLAEAGMGWLDVAKKWIGYGKVPTMGTSQLYAEARALVDLVIDLGDAGKVPTETIKLANIAKLITRYNGITFSKACAVNPDKAAEAAAQAQVIG